MDPIRLNLVTRALESIPAEMSINMLKAAYSSIVREAKDFATNLFDPHGKSVTQSEQIPILVAALSTALRFVIEKHPLHTWKPGELVITNDPFHGGQHLNDIALFMPILVDGERVGIAGAIAHHLDLGGVTAGIIGSATEIFHDGMLFPRIKFAMRDGKLDPVLEEMIRANTRVPDETVGDLHAQIVALRTAQARLGTIVGKFGKQDVLNVMDRLQDYAEALTRQEIGSFPDGESAGEALVDDDSQGNGPFVVRAKVVIRDTELGVDFSGTDAQARGTINCPFASTLAATYTAIRQVVNTRVTVPANDGSTRPISVTAPRGSLVNPLSPASVHARFITAYRCYEAVMDALAKVVPERTTAVGFNSTYCFAFAVPRTGDYRIMSETTAGGWGAGPRSDGADALPLPLSNCSNVPAEWVEHQFPYLRVNRYEVVQDSCGHGRQRGGLGELKEYEILEDDVEFSGMCDRFLYPAKGIYGGTEGAKGSLNIMRGEKILSLPSKSAASLRRHDRVQFVTGGGGGFGPPAERSRESVENDVKAGYISEEVARRVYGMEPDA